MATRYWVGGTGNWNDIAHWSSTSGGVGGASVPAMDDDVYFDSNSGTGTVTVNTTANMRDCTFTQTQLITLTNAAYAFNIYGNWTLCNNAYLATLFTGTGYIYLKATTSVNITSNGCTRAWNRLHFDGVGGEWLLQDGWDTGSSSLYFAGGHFKTENNNLSCSSLNTFSHIGTKELSLGASVVTLTGTYGIGFAHNGFSLNAGTSTINNYGIYIQVPSSASITFYNLNQYTRCLLFYESTFNNLKFYITSVNTIEAHSSFRSLTVNNTLEINGADSNKNRILVYSGVIGTPITITCNGTVTASNVDFRDIVGAGTANWDLSAIEGGSGDCGGNSGIAFTPAQTQYFKHTLGAVNWSDVTKWFSNYERTIQGRVPLPQDDAIFDETSFTGASTLYINVVRIGGLNMEGVDEDVVVNITLFDIEVYKDFILGTFITIVTYRNVYLSSRYTNVLNTFAKSMYGLGVRGLGTYINNSNIVLKSVFQVVGGIFDFNDFDMVAVGIYTWNGGTNYILPNSHMVYFGNGTFTFRGYTVESSINFNNPNSIICENSTIILSPQENNPNQTIGMKGVTLNKLVISGTVVGNFNIIGNNTIAELIIDSGRKVRFNNGTTQTINKLTAIGTPEQPITIGSTTSGQRHTINYTGSEHSTVEYCNISDSKVTQARRLLAKISVDAGNNQNWWFEGLPLLALNFGQVDKMYVGGSEVMNAYYGEIKIK